MDSNRKIAHIDMDAFFASVEQLDNPELKGEPVIVGGLPQSRGVVAACSYEARRFGIHSAMACARAFKLCPRAIFIRPRISRYKEISQQIMAIFLQYTDLVEPLSLDEAFLDLTRSPIPHHSATQLAEMIRRQIYNETGLTASAGVSCNKFLAKIATELNKPNGISVIRPSNALEFIHRLPIGKFYGVGKVTEQHMLRLGIRTGGDLQRFSRDEMLFHFGKTGDFFHSIAQGKDPRPVQPSRERKSIGSETTLARDTTDLQEISTILGQLAESVAGSLHRHCCGGHRLTLKIRYHDFTTITRSRTTKNNITTRADILDRLPRLIRATEAGRKRIRLLGISIANLTASRNRPIQLRLPFR
jgi:DNA polymerase IV